MKIAIIVAALFLLISCSDKTTGIQGSGGSSVEVKETMLSRNYVFKANTALPARGRTIQLNSVYTFIVKKDSIVSNLPYFGRAFTAPIGQSGGGIEFVSTDFEYREKEKDNGSFDIEIIPRDFNNIQRINLTVTKSGYGNLYVNSQNRQAISFNGYIEKIKP